MMRRLSAFATLAVAACASTPQVPVRPVPTVVEPVERGDLIGLSTEELGQRFGAPTLTVREGEGLKLQYRARGCVLDAYLYRAISGQGVPRVTHVDTRDPQGRDVAQAACLAELTRA